MTFETSKTLGGIGAILIFIGVFPLINTYGIVEIIGAILVLYALHDFANIYRESGIFSNALYGIVVAIVGGVVTAVLAFAVVISNLKDLVTQLYPGWNGDWSTLQGMTPNTNIDPSAIFPLIGGLIAVLVVVWIVAIIASFFIYRSLKQVSNKSNVGLFGTAGLLLLIGAIIPFVGLFLMWISALLLTIAFFTLKAPEQPMAPPAPSPP